MDISHIGQVQPYRGWDGAAPVRAGIEPRQRLQWANQLADKPTGPECTASYSTCPTVGSSACTNLAR